MGTKKVQGVQDKRCLTQIAKQLKFQFWKSLQFYLDRLLCQAASPEKGCMTKLPHLQWILSPFYLACGDNGVGLEWGGGLFITACPGHPWRRREREHLWLLSFAQVRKNKVIKLKLYFDFLLWRMCCWDFPGGTVGKNPPANAGDTGSSPGLGGSHMP